MKFSQCFFIKTLANILKTFIVIRKVSCFWPSGKWAIEMHWAFFNAVAVSSDQCVTFSSTGLASPLRNHHFICRRSTGTCWPRHVLFLIKIVQRNALVSEATCGEFPLNVSLLFVDSLCSYLYRASYVAVLHWSSVREWTRLNVFFPNWCLTLDIHFQHGIISFKANLFIKGWFL